MLFLRWESVVNEPTRNKTTEPLRAGKTSAEVSFSPESANRALVYVRRVTADIVARYHELLDLKRLRDELIDSLAAQTTIDNTLDRIRTCVSELNRLHQELTDVGCVLKDWEHGLVDFPALYQGRRVWLCWQLGEEHVAHWHELHDGFGRRQEIDDAFICDRNL